MKITYSYHVMSNADWTRVGRSIGNSVITGLQFRNGQTVEVRRKLLRPVNRTLHPPV